jgi:signal transduction histidine kinase
MKTERRYCGRESALDTVRCDQVPVEERLQELTGRLINAQEKERRRIARELHDDLNQQLALLSINLEQLGQKLKKASNLHKQMQDLCARAREISNEVHRMSYQLHPSKLETLGLVAAVSSLCHEVSKSQGLKIVFSHRDVLGSISNDVALCLFRVAQESLHNAVKHSGAKRARVELIGIPQAIHLLISDTGAGFDVEAARRKGGLGLVSMEERLRLVGGEISIHSQPLHGARIEVEVPLSVKALAA